MKTHFETVDFRNDLLAATYDELPLWSAPFGLKLLETIDYSLPVTALDIGCGTGFPLLELAQRFGHKSHFYGIDPWSEGLNHLQKKILCYEITNVSVSCAAAEKLPFDNEMFNLITSNNGLNNAESFENSIFECHRTLKNGGRLIFTSNLPGTFSLFYEILINTFAEAGKAEAIPLIHEHIKMKRKSIDETCVTLEKSGFRTNLKKTESFTLRFSSGTSFLNHFLIRLYFMNSWLTLIPGNDQSQIMNLVEEKLNSLSLANHGLCMEVPFALYLAEKC